MDHSPPLHAEPPPPAPRPPDHGALGEAVVVIAQELQHAFYGGNVTNEVRNLRDDINRLIGGVNRLSRCFRRLEHSFCRLEHSHRRLEEKINMMPLRSFNASAHSRVPVLYPYPYRPTRLNHLPRTKGELERISGINAQRVLVHLGFHPDTIPANAQQRKDMLLTHLGLKVDVGPFLYEGNEEEEEEEEERGRRRRMKIKRRSVLKRMTIDNVE
ncbi:hypothetical protein Agabi119p4_7959 [Agaricus bisporus var. burnettii]|uniref:Uncharacterized protein n=1 Tax=Agaricus bisporus var. burnettii TaxID=192524 RepID=A0A8H7EXW6_AGABI|nr:hypothetical protein Agabi119p4_7959 [Agaricus bisporus var. burnettii]